MAPRLGMDVPDKAWWKFLAFRIAESSSVIIILLLNAIFNVPTLPLIVNNNGNYSVR